MTFDGETEIKNVQLPAREAEILALAAKGLTDKLISAELGISRDTVSTYWRRILLRYKAANRTEVVARAVESQLTKKINEAEGISAQLKEEIHQRSEAQAKDLATRNLLVSVQSALVAFVSGNPSTADIFNDLLGELLSATASEFGLIAEITHGATGEAMMRNLALSNIAWDEPSRIRYETELFTEFTACKNDNLIGAAIGLGAPFIANNVVGNPQSAGVPNGHPPIHCFFALPVYNGTEMVGLIGIANRSTGYDDALVADLGPLVATCGAIISGSRARQKRLAAEARTAGALAQFDTLLNVLDSAIILVDEDRIVRFVNQSFCNEFMRGARPADIIGENARELMAKFSDEFPEPTAHIAAAEQILSTRQERTGDEVRTSDGRRFLRDFHPLTQGTQSLGHVWKFRKMQ
jgi:DNA-binding CsgD family transcriptional regulator